MDKSALSESDISDKFVRPAILKQAGLVSSTSEALRMIDGGGVRVDGEKVGDRNAHLSVGTCVVLQVGKRKFARVVVG